MRPNAEANEPDGDHGADHRDAAENRFARENRNDLGQHGETREDQDVDFRVAEDPEKMLPQNGRSAGLRIEEVGAQIAVHEAT